MRDEYILCADIAGETSFSEKINLLNEIPYYNWHLLRKLIPHATYASIALIAIDRDYVRDIFSNPSKYDFIEIDEALRYANRDILRTINLMHFFQKHEIEFYRDNDAIFKLFKEYLTQEQQVQLLVEQQDACFENFGNFGEDYIRLITRKENIMRLFEKLTDNYYKYLLIITLESTLGNQTYEELNTRHQLAKELQKRLPLDYRKELYPEYIE